MMIKYITLNIVIFTLLTSNLYSEEWQLVQTSKNPSFEQFIDLKCADSNNCMIRGTYYGNWGYSFLKLSDGGKICQKVYADSTPLHPDVYWKRIWDIAYPDTSLFLAVGDSGMIIRTTDGGFTWDKFYLEKGRRIYKIKMLDKNYGILLAGRYDGNSIGGRFYKTEDGGLTWNQIKNTPQEYWDTYLDGIDIIDRNQFVVLADVKDSTGEYQSEIVWVKNDWEECKTYKRHSRALYIDFINEKKGWISGGNILAPGYLSQLILYTEDAGITWTQQRDVKMNGYGADDITFFDEKHGMATSGFGVMLMTNNGGKTWYDHRIENERKHTLWGLQFPSITTAYIVAEGSSIYKYTRDWSVSAEEKENNGFAANLYPNPASDKVTVALTKELGGEAVITISDMQGLPLLTHKTRDFMPEIDLSSLNSGIYAVSIHTGNAVITKKLSVAK